MTRSTKRLPALLREQAAQTRAEINHETPARWAREMRDYARHLDDKAAMLEKNTNH